MKYTYIVYRCTHWKLRSAALSPMTTSGCCLPTWTTVNRTQTPTRMDTTRSPTTSTSKRLMSIQPQAMTSKSLLASNVTRRVFSANTSSQSRGRIERFRRRAPMMKKSRSKATT